LLGFQLEDDLAEVVAALAADGTAGPTALARRGAAVALMLTEKYYYERPLHIWQEVNGLARALVQARPECMPLVNFANDFVRPLPEVYGRGPDEGARMRADLRARVEAWLARLEPPGQAGLEAWAVDDTTAWVRGSPPAGAVVAGPHALVPLGYRLPDDAGLTPIPRATCAGLDSLGPRPRLEPALL
jgi:hypothetical protein